MGDQLVPSDEQHNLTALIIMHEDPFDPFGGATFGDLSRMFISIHVEGWNIGLVQCTVI